MYSPKRHPELVSGSTLPRGSRVGRKAQSNCKVMPIGVSAFDEVDLPLSTPALQLLFACDSWFHFGKALKIHQSDNAVTLCEARITAFPVFPKPSDKVGCDTDIQRATRLARKDVNGRFSLFSHPSDAMAPWTLKQVQGDAVGVSKSSSLYSDLKKACS